jgi:hypothetical protein
MTRTRDRQFVYTDGTRIIYNQDGSIESLSHSSSPSIWERCTDEAGLKARDFGVRRNYQKKDGGVLNRPGSWPVISFNDWRLSALQSCNDSYIMSAVGVPGVPSLNELAVKLLNETSPSRSSVELPNAIWELREIPKLLKLEGDNWIRKGASANLSYQFGWKPMLSDLVKLYDFQKACESRMKEIKALHEGGLRRKRRLWSGSATATSSRFVQTNGFNTGSVNFPKATTAQYWGFVKWFPASPPPMTVRDWRQLAWDAVHGWTVDAATVWNAIPWSWLADWCGNVGDYLSSRRNLIPATHSVPLIMWSTNTTISWQYSHPNVSHWEGGVITKNRRRVTPSLSASLPILTGRQLSILGSIGVTRRSRGNR